MQFTVLGEILNRLLKVTTIFVLLGSSLKETLQQLNSAVVKHSYKKLVHRLKSISFTKISIFICIITILLQPVLIGIDFSLVTSFNSRRIISLTGRLDDLEKVVSIALQHNPNESSIHFNYASALGKASLFEQSEQHFLLAIKYNSKVATYHSNLGKLYCGVLNLVQSNLIVVRSVTTLS